MDEENLEGTDLLEDNYYSFLNVSRDAPPEDITNAYRRLSRSYHPDKHTDPIRKKEAELLFNKIKKAYEVLKDPHKRAIYDSVGIKGLETDGWEVIQRTKTPQEIREEYERLAREKEERRLQQRTNPKGTLVVNINATDVFNRYVYDDYDYDLSNSVIPVEVSGMSFSQSVEAPLTRRDTSTIGGHLSMSNGTGQGSVSVTNRRTLSEKTWIEVGYGAGSGSLFIFKAFRTLSKRTFAQADAFVLFGPNGVRTNLDASLGVNLNTGTMGYLTWRGGSTSGMSTTYVRDTQSSHTNITLLVGLPHSYASAAFTWKRKEAKMKLKTLLKFGTAGITFEYGAEKKLSELSTVSASVSIGVPSGVIVKLRLTRGSQSYLFPVQLCDEPLPSPVFYGTVTPLLVYALVKRFIIDPIVDEEEAAQKKKQKTTYMTRMAEKKKEAKAAVDLMSVTFSRIRSEEETKRGLVIVAALYGKLAVLGSSPDPAAAASSAAASGGGQDPASVSGHSEEVIDVTIPVQCLVKNSQLVIYESTKSQLPGFYDPCVSEEKHLYVQYLFHNQLHETTVKDNEPLRIPRQSHRVVIT